MFQIRQNESTATRKRAPILLVDATDGFTPETGVTSPTITISKNGAAGIGGTGTFSEVSNGIYSYEFAASEIDTLGWIALNVRKTGVTRDYNAIIQIMSYDYADVVNLGLTSLPDVAIGSTGALLTSYTSNGAIDVTSTGAVNNVETVVGGVTLAAGTGTSVAYDVWNFDITGIGATNIAGGALEAAASASGSGTGSSAEFAMAVWDYDVTAYGSTGQAGDRLYNNGNYVWTVDLTTLANDIWMPSNRLSETYNAVYDPNIPGVIIGDRVWTYNTGTGNSAAEQLNLAAAGGAGVSAAQIADAVWGWDATGYANPAAGYTLTNADANAASAAGDALTAASNTAGIDAQVWGTDISAYTSPSAGYELLNAGAGSGSSSAVEIAGEVWGYSSGRTITGGIGVTLATALPANFSDLSITSTTGLVTTSNPGTGSTATVQQIAEAVWDANVVGVGDTTSAAYTLANTYYTAGNIETYVSTQTPQDIWSYAGVEGRTITGGTGVTLATALPTNFSTLAIDGSGYVTYNNAATGSSTPTEIAAAVWDYDVTGYTSTGQAGDRLYNAWKYVWEADFNEVSIGDYWQAGNKLSEVYNSVYDPNIPGVIIGDRVWTYNTGTGNSAAEQLNLAATGAGSGSSTAVEIAEEVWAYATRDITGGTIDTNNDKTGYDLTQSFPANFADLSITASTGLVTTSNPGTGSTATPQDVASAVWEADPVNYNNVGTFGKLVLRSDNSSVTGIVTMWSGASYNGVMADAYRIDESYDAAINLKNVLTGIGSTVTGNIVGSVDTVVNDVNVSSASIADIADATWSEDISGYTSPSAGYDLANVNAGSGGSSAVEIAEQVWVYATRDITGGTIDTNNDKTGYSLTQNFPANFEDLSITATTGLVTTSNPGTGSSTPEEIAAATWSYATRDITGGTIDTNNDKTGYSLTQSFPANFEDLSITATTGLVTTSNPGTGSSTPAEIANAVWSFDISTGPASPSASYYIDNINTEATSAATDASTAASNTNDIGGTVWQYDPTALTSPQAGAILTDIQTDVNTIITDIGNVPNNVWASDVSGYTNPGEAGYELMNAGAGSGGSSAIEIAETVWQYNTGTGASAAAQLNAAAIAGSGGSSAIQVAEEVWAYATRDITGGEIDTNNDKTGYSLTQNFPANFEDLSITATTGLVTTSNPGTGSTSTPEDIAAATWGYGSGRTITGGTGVTLATSLPSNFSTLDIDGTGKVSVQSADITTIKSGLSTLTQAEVGTEVDSSLVDVGLTTTVTGRIDADISSRLASASVPANFADMSITATTGLVSIGQTVPSASAISTAVWTANRSAIGPSSGQFGYFLDARVSQAGGGAVTTVQLGPFDLRASDSVNGYLDALVDDERTIAVAITDDNGNPIPLDSANTHNVLVYDANSTLVATYPATVEYEAGGAASFFLDVDVTGTAGTYKCVFDIDNGSYISKFGGLTILVKLC
jgi:hypothetical protein